MQKFLYCLLVWILISPNLFGCAGVNLENDPSYIISQQTKFLYQNYDKTFSNLIQSGNKEDLNKLLQISQLAHSKAGEAYRIWDPMRPTDKDYQFAKATAEYCGKTACLLLLSTAGLYAKYDDKNIAKILYRNIIVSYTGFIYQSYVRSAQFALSDLN
jgi:hypothetical protein